MKRLNLNQKFYLLALVGAIIVGATASFIGDYRPDEPKNQMDQLITAAKDIEAAVKNVE